MEWISTKDRLPELEVEVLVSSCHGCVITELHNGINGYYWYSEPHCTEFEGYNYWMPTPNTMFQIYGKSLLEYLRSVVSKKLEPIGDNYHRTIKLYFGNWIFSVIDKNNSDELNYGHIDEVEKFYIVPNQYLTCDEIYHYLEDKLHWTAKSHPRGI